MSESDYKLFEQIDRLVDGELNESQLRELLIHCEEGSDRWRDVALAFVESQMVRHELSAFRQHLPSADRVSPSPVATRANSHPTWNRIFSVAAAMIFAIGIGYGLGHFTKQNPGNAVVKVDGNQSTSDLVNDDRLTVPEEDSLLMLVHDRQQDRLKPIEVPLLPEHQAFVEESPIPVDMVEAFKKAGHQIHQTRRYVPIELHDGRRVLLPVDDVRVQGFQ